jgi:UPF0755 protein
VSYEEQQIEEPRKRGALARILTSLFLLGMFAIILVAGTLFFATSEMAAKGPLKASKIITVKRGTGTSKIAQMLEKEGVISNSSIFMMATYAYRRSRGSLKAGEYEIPAGASMSKVLKLLQTGKALAYKVTVPEGWTTQKAVARINANKVLKGQLTLTPAEGSLLPDTYVFERGSTRDSVLKRMISAQQKLLDKLWNKRAENLPIKTRREAVILASIVERETGISSERAKVAAVFINRLNKNMRLQSDPTIIYGIVGGKGKMDRPLSKKDIATKTPFNTYQIDGLPPTPIANPGREAIAAVLNPAVTDDLFFVADGSGGHAFAKTLKDHQANVVKWRKIERDKRNAGAASPTAGKTAKAAKASQPAKTKQAKPVAATKKPALSGAAARTPDGKTIPLPPVNPAAN